MKQFSSGEIEYYFGLMFYKERSGFRSPGDAFVEQLPSGDYITMLHRMADRRLFTWEDIKPMTDFCRKITCTSLATLSYIYASVKIEKEPINYHKLMVKVFT